MGKERVERTPELQTDRQEDKHTVRDRDLERDRETMQTYIQLSQTRYGQTSGYVTYLYSVTIISEPKW